MKTIVVEQKDSGQRLSKLIIKFLKSAPASFVYKMLRKKNITLNGKKATGNEILNPGDEIKLFLSDDTISLFQKEKAQGICLASQKDINRLIENIIYEDENLIVINKWAGILSQKATDSDISINEVCISYLLGKGEISDEDLLRFKPSVCNRLDRNTTGIILFAKTYIMANALSQSLHLRTTHKHYKCIVKGRLDKKIVLNDYLIKDEKSNKVSVTNSPCEGASKIETNITPLMCSDVLSLVEVELITGKSHQIRAHLSSVNHPIGGDSKYGSKSFNQMLYDKYKVHHQLLHSYKTKLADFDNPLFGISGKEFIAPLPQEFEDIIHGCLEKQRP